MKHLLTLLTVILAATACGNSNSVADLSNQQVVLPTFTLACSVALTDNTSESSFGIRSARVTYSAGSVAMRLDRNDLDVRYAADAAQNVVATGSYLKAAWTSADVSFAAEELERNIFIGELRVSGNTVPVKCVKFVTDDRDGDEFSLACTPTDTGASLVVIKDVVLTYEDRELEMFINPTGEREIFDLERTSMVKVSELEVYGEWGSQNTSFRSSSKDGDRFGATLNYNGAFVVRMVCWKI